MCSHGRVRTLAAYVLRCHDVRGVIEALLTCHILNDALATLIITCPDSCIRC